MGECAKFHAKFVPNERFVAGSFYELISSFVLKDLANLEVKAPLLRFALLKAEYSCPKSKVIHKQCLFLNKSDIDNLSRKRTNAAIEAETVLAQARDMAFSLQDKVSNDVHTRLFGRLDVNVARVVAQKQKGSAAEYASVQAAGTAFWNELKSVVGADCPANPWAAHNAPQTSGPPPSSHDIEGMQSFTPSGQFLPTDLVNVLKAKGFIVGSFVAHKMSKDQKRTVVEIAISIKVKDSAGEVVAIDCKEFFANYRSYDEQDFPFGDEHSSEANEQ